MVGFGIWFLFFLSDIRVVSEYGYETHVYCWVNCCNQYFGFHLNYLSYVFNICLSWATGCLAGKLQI